jgi:hypothetical protein
LVSGRLRPAGSGVFEATDKSAAEILGAAVDQPFLLTLPDLAEELEDREDEELDRPEDAERPEEDEPLDFGVL